MEIQTEKAKQTKRHRLVVEPLGISFFVDHGETIFEGAIKHEVPIRSDCGGQGKCGKCLTVAHPVEKLSPASATEADILTSEQILSGHRLACQAQVRGRVTVTLSEERLETLKAVGKTDLQAAYPVDPLVRRLVVDSASLFARGDDSPWDPASRVKEVARELMGKEFDFVEPSALLWLSRHGAKSGPVTIVCHEQKGVTAILPGEKRRSLGVAVDLGTTTVAAYLCDLTNDGVLTARAATNPQVRIGEDVMSRIAFAKSRQSGTETLNELIVAEVNGLISDCLEEVGAAREDIDELNCAGNTTMQYIFAGLNPRNLGASPYMPESSILHDRRAQDLGLALNPGANVHFLPVISGFVGGDTVGATLAARPHHEKEITLIVDIGTNGEMVLGNRDGLWVTSCATGPAFEGAHISCGMRAVSGAIISVKIDPLRLNLNYRVIGDSADVSPMGICGSGIVDAVAEMRRTGVLLSNGRLKESAPGVIVDERGIGREFLLVAPKNSAMKQKMTLTLEDIRQIQLAKAALCTGIILLMRRAGLRRVDRLVLTGAFGARFDWRNGAAIGMFPQEAVGGQVEAVDNLAGVGAVMSLLDKNRREEAKKLSRQVQHVELAKDPDFAEEFSKAMAFPPLAG